MPVPEPEPAPMPEPEEEPIPMPEPVPIPEPQPEGCVYDPEQPLPGLDRLETLRAVTGDDGVLRVYQVDDVENS